MCRRERSRFPPENATEMSPPALRKVKTETLWRTQECPDLPFLQICSWATSPSWLQPVTSTPHTTREFLRARCLRVHPPLRGLRLLFKGAYILSLLGGRAKGHKQSSPKSTPNRRGQMTCISRAVPRRAWLSGVTAGFHNDVKYLLGTYFVPGPGNTAMNPTTTVSAMKKFPNKQTHELHNSGPGGDKYYKENAVQGLRNLRRKKKDKQQGLRLPGSGLPSKAEATASTKAPRQERV